MDDSYNRRLHPGSLDDDTYIAPGTPLRIAHTTPLRAAPWGRCLVDVLHSHTRCSTRDYIRAQLGLLPAKYRIRLGTAHYGSVVGALLTAGSSRQTLAQG